MYIDDLTSKSDFWKNIWPKLLGGGSWAIFGRFTIIVCGLITNALLARMMPPENIGLYFLAVSFISFFAILLPLGLDQIIVKFITESLVNQLGGQIYSAIKFTLLIYLSSTLVIVLCYFSGVFHWIFQTVFNTHQLGNTLFLVIMTSVAIGLINVSSQILRGFHDFRSAVIIQNVLPSGLFLISVFILFSLKLPVNLDILFKFLLIINFMSFLASVLILKSKYKNINKNGGLTLSSIAKTTLPIWLTAVLTYCFSQTDIWIVAAFLSEQDIAIYGSSTRIVAFVSMPLLIANTVLPAVISELFAKTDRENLERALRYTAAITTVPAIIISAIFLLFGKSILGLIFTDFYSSGYQALIILSLGQLVNVYLGSCGWALLMTGNQFVLFKITCITGIVTICASIILAKYFGIEGIATGVSSGLIIQNILMTLSAKRFVGVWTFADFSLFNILYKNLATK